MSVPKLKINQVFKMTNQVAGSIIDKDLVA
jgi:hypothetical protein